MGSAFATEEFLSTSSEAEQYLAGAHVASAAVLVAEAIPRPHQQNLPVLVRPWALAASEVALGEASETVEGSEGEATSAIGDEAASVAASEAEEVVSAISLMVASEHQMARLLGLEAALAVEVGMEATVVGTEAAVEATMTVDRGTLTTSLYHHEAAAIAAEVTEAATETETLEASTEAKSGLTKAAAAGTKSPDHAGDTDELRPREPQQRCYWWVW